MDRAAFYNMFREYTEEVPHGFLVIDNDPNIPYEQKFYYGLAEELPVDLEHIVGCKESWKKDLKQLTEIGNGSMGKKIEAISQISKPGTINDDPDCTSGKSCLWDTREFLTDPDDAETHELQDASLRHLPPELRKFIKGSHPRLAQPKPARGSGLARHETLREEDRRHKH